jgi:hypothetical protein
MKKILLISLLLFSISLCAQTIFPDNGRWYQKYHSIAWGHGGEVLWDITTYSNFKVQGDSVMNGSDYLKLYENNVFSGYILVDSLKVYFGNHPDSLYLLFDYGLSLGDTFHFHGPNYTGGNDNLTLSVISTDTVLIYGVYRKRILFSEFPGYGAGPSWIQGIGDVNFGGIETDYSYVSWANNTNTLLCFSQDGENIFGSCAVGLTEPEKVGQIGPNPSHGIFTMRINDQEVPYNIQVYSSTGQLVESRTPGNLIESFDLTSEGKGLYFLRTIGKNGSKTFKVIIQ